jgi:hypothetical protein
MRMNAAETSASRAIADWMPLTVAPRSWTTAEIDTFINEVSTTSTNIAIESSIARRRLKRSLGTSESAVASAIRRSSRQRAPAPGARLREER